MIRILLLILLTSCASGKNFKEEKVVSPEFKAYYDNWRLNNNFAQKFKDKPPIEIRLYWTLGYSSIVGICKLDEDKFDERYIKVDSYYWKNFPNKREGYINHLLNICYSANLKTSITDEIPYYGF